MQLKLHPAVQRPLDDRGRLCCLAMRPQYTFTAEREERDGMPGAAEGPGRDRCGISRWTHTRYCNSEPAARLRHGEHCSQISG